MARIPEQTIDRIREAADVLDVVSDYVQMKRKGRNYFGLCPFHQEKSPSFSVNQDRQIFHCFGCSRGGNVFSFIMEIERVDFVEAVKRLGEKTGIEVELSGAVDPKRKALVQQIMDLYERATSIFAKTLAGQEGSSARSYLHDRGFTDDTIELFRIGYVPDRWDHLLKLAGTKDFSNEALNQSGLFMAGQKGPYDRFRGRIMFPIANASGRTVAMAGRVFGTDDAAKYMNSPESPIYHKGEVLYGLSHARQAIREKEQTIIVEGYLDLIQLHQAGITHVVAVSGTALTERHARELRKLTPNVFLAYDGDAAGIQAAVRAGYTLLQGGLDPRIVALPGDTDPDDWVKQAGPSPFLAAVQGGSPLLDFQRKHFSGDLRQTGDMRRFLDEALRGLAPIADPLVKELHLKRLAELTGVSEAHLHRSIEALPKIAPRQSETGPDELKVILVEPTRSHKAQMTLIRLAFQDHIEVLNLLVDEVTPELFTHAALKRIWELLGPTLADATIPEVGQVMTRLPDQAHQQLLSGMVMAGDESGDLLSLAIDCLTALYRDSLQSRIEERRLDLRAAEQGAGVPSQDILKEVAALRQSLTELSHQFDKYRA
ncbi:MAG: DNA primase [Candidatus Marinimicrobia bacterium]|nr:DNA primase [Candidatus Neomarinimicrobiota bacterium]